MKKENGPCETSKSFRIDSLMSFCRVSFGKLSTDTGPIRALNSYFNRVRNQRGRTLPDERTTNYY